MVQSSGRRIIILLKHSILLLFLLTIDSLVFFTYSSNASLKSPSVMTFLKKLFQKLAASPGPTLYRFSSSNEISSHVELRSKKALAKMREKAVDIVAEIRS